MKQKQGKAATFQKNEVEKEDVVFITVINTSLTFDLRSIETALPQANSQARIHKPI